MHRILFVTDIHGSDRLFLKLMNAAKVYGAETLIIGGDIAGKTLIPVFQRNDGYSTEFNGEKRILGSKDELERLVRDIRAAGEYAYITTEEEWKSLLKDEKRLNELFERLIEENIRSWCEIAEERLRPIHARLIMNTGNDDPPELGKVIESSGFVEYPNEKVIELDAHHEMISLGYSNITPWRLPGDLPEDEIAARIQNLVSKTKDIRNAIFNIHVPPYNTHLDVAPKLDADLKPKLSPGGEPEFVHVGSTAVRQAIERYQPLAGLHGHIHESRGYSRIGRTHCFNPGSEYSAGVLKGVLINLGDDKIVSHIFTSG
ncbi:MAG: metallophosphoesterase [Conexivisphaerales archaeon]